MTDNGQAVACCIMHGQNTPHLADCRIHKLTSHANGIQQDGEVATRMWSLHRALSLVGCQEEVG